MASNDPYIPPTAAQMQENSNPPTLANISLFLVVVPYSAIAVMLQLNSGNTSALAANPNLSLSIGLTVIAGFITALIAFFTRDGKKGVILRAGFALLISGGTISLSASGFIQARQRAMAHHAEMEENTKTLKEKRASQEAQNAAASVVPAIPPALAEYNGPEVATIGSTEYHLMVAPAQKTSQAMKAAAQKKTGPEATALRIASEYLAAMEVVSSAHQVAEEKLRAHGPLGPIRNTRAELAKHRELVNAVVVPSEKYFELNLEMESYLTQALRREKLPEAFVQKFVGEFISGRKNSQVHVLAMKARSANLRGCKGLLNAVTLLDREFGMPARKNAQWGMRSAAVDDEYSAILKEIITASTELQQIGLQQRAVKTARR
jgi:hypothetical protein